MVQIEPQIEPPCEELPQQVAVGSAGVDSQAITQESISSEPSESAAISDVHGFSGESAGASDQLGRPDWQSARTKRTRQVALVALVSLTGLMASIVVFVWFVRSFRNPDVAMEADSSVVPAEPDAASMGDSAIDVESTDESTDPENPTEPTTDTEGEGPPDPARPEPARPEPSAASGPGPMIADAGNDTPPSDLIPQSPLGDPITSEGPIIPTQPGGSALIPPDPLAADEPKDDDASTLQELPPELAKYTKFLLDEGPADETTMPAPPSMDDLDLEDAAAQDFNFLGRAEPRELNLKADLGIRLALSSEGYALADLMLLVSQATGVPIQIDWVSFDLAGISITKRIDVGAGWQTAQALLDRIAETLGGEFREEKNLLILTLTDESFQETMDRIADLQDFATGQESATSVLNSFLGGDPEQAKLAIDDSREQRQLAGLAIEGMRRMRGIDAKVPDAALRHWAGPADQSVEWPVVTGGQAGPQPDSPIAIASLFRRTARLNQSTCIVNWYDAISRGAAPELTMIPHMKEDAASTLQHALEPFELQVRQVDQGHWWVGSAPTYDRLTAVVWTQPLGDSKDTFLQRIENIMQGASPDVYRIAYDQASDRVLLLLPRFIVRQLPKITPAIAAK